MSGQSLLSLTPDRLLRLAELSDVDFETLLLGFLRSRPLLTINRHGKAVTARVIDATTISRSGRTQQGIDVLATMEGGEKWAFQCKRVKSWNLSQTETAIAHATHAANHFILVLACNPPIEVHQELDKHANWSLWNLDTTCAEIRQRTPLEQLPRILPFLSPNELKRFTPFATSALITHKEFFADRLGSHRTFRHDWNLVGRARELEHMNSLFLPDGPRGVILYSKGGDGKSRLLLEFARAAELAGERVLFLNPNGSTDALEFSLLRDDPRFVIVVDDAHRSDSRHIPLMRLVEQEKRARLVFATRPQGFEPLLSRLIETGLRQDFKEMSLPPLKKGEIRALAEQSLGPEKQQFVETLTGLTKDSAFLTVLAGDLIQQNKLTPDAWASEADFRFRVFKAFEEENLSELSADDRKTDARILRVIALLAPVDLGGSFAEKGARVVGVHALSVEQEIRRLRRIALLTEGSDDARIIPDLFADFLAYDVAVDSRNRLPSLVNGVRAEFPECAAAILRNLAEAAWVGGPPTSDVDAMLQPLVDVEFERFKSLSFYRRVMFLSEWSHYGIFLPRQTIALAKLALASDAPPTLEPNEDHYFPDPGTLNNHAYVSKELPALLKPIALYHDAHRDAALEILWQLRQWETIGSILKPEAGKSVGLCLAGLDWVAGKLARPVGRQILTEDSGMLNAVLRGCFARFMEFRNWRGMTLSISKAAMPMAETAEIRRKALAILQSVVALRDWKTTIGVIRATHDLTWRIPNGECPPGKDEPFREQWREDRMAGLSLLRDIASGFPEAAIRYLVRVQLRSLCCYEEDLFFREACREVVAAIPDDLALRMTRALSNDCSEDMADSSDGEKGWDAARARWDAVRGEIFAEFLTAHPVPGEMLSAVARLDADLRLTGGSPSVWSFFGHLAQHAPVVATAIANLLLDSPDSRLAYAWPALIAEFASDADLLALQRRSMVKLSSQAARATILHLLNPGDSRPTNDTGRQLLVEAAKSGDETANRAFLRALVFGFQRNSTLAREIIPHLQIAIDPDEEATPALQILTKYCNPNGGDEPLVQAILNWCARLPDFDLSKDPNAWHMLITHYPRQLFDFLRSRVEFEATGDAPKGFLAMPAFRQIWLDTEKLQSSPDFAQLRDDLWKRAMSDKEYPYNWVRLFQSLGLNDIEWLMPRLLAEIEAATAVERLRWLCEFVAFRGSLIVFRRPELTRQLLIRAHELGNYDAIRAALYCATGPQYTSWENGELDSTDDYVEAEAMKAAEHHSSDPELYQFYRWIVECERSQKRRNRTEHELRLRQADD